MRPASRISPTPGRPPRCPPARPAPTFSVNGSNAAQNTSVTFAAAGTYVFTARISDPSGLSVTSSVTVVVSPTLSRIALSPAAVTLAPGTSQQFAAAGFDQFGNPLASLPGLTWSASAGAITSGGLFTAGGSPASATVTATSGSIKGTAVATVAASDFLGLKDPRLAALVESLDADGSISRNDMVQILDTVSGEGSLVSSADFSDLKTILGDAATLKMPGYVQVLAGDVINGNAANASFEGQALGNLSTGSPSSRLTDLVAKWFLGTDLPGVPAGTTYAAASGSLFNGTPSYHDELQGELGDCYFISALGSIADASPAAVQNMFIYNGDNTWTVRFYDNGVADYVTVNNMLPVNSAGQLVYADYGRSASSTSNTLWIPLAEKAYAQWNQTGKEGRDGQNLYSSIAGGWMADVDAQVLGHSATSYTLSTSSDQAALVNAMTNNLAVTIGTDTSNLSSDALAYGLYGSHAYAIIGYNSKAGTFDLYNPWGFDQPGVNGWLTWSQLQSTCEGFVVASVGGLGSDQPGLDAVRSRRGRRRQTAGRGSAGEPGGHRPGCSPARRRTAAWRPTTWRANRRGAVLRTPAPPAARRPSVSPWRPTSFSGRSRRRLCFSITNSRATIAYHWRDMLTTCRVGQALRKRLAGPPFLPTLGGPAAAASALSHPTIAGKHNLPAHADGGRMCLACW